MMLSRRSILQQGSECCHASTSCHNHLQRTFYPVRSPHAPFIRSNVNSSSSSAVAAAPAAVVPTVESSRRGARQHVSSRLVAAAAAAQQAAPPLEAAYRPPEPHKLVMTVAGQQVCSSSWVGRREHDSHTALPALQLAVSVVKPLVKVGHLGVSTCSHCVCMQWAWNASILCHIPQHTWPALWDHCCLCCDQALCSTNH